MQHKLIRTKQSRREFAKALTAGSLAAGLAPAANFDNSTVQVLSLLRLDGTLSTDYATRALYALDFGNIVHEMPMAVLKPGSVHDVRRIVQLANEFGFRFTARGPGHSIFGQT